MTKDRLDFLREKYKTKNLKHELEFIAYHARCGYIQKEQMDVICWMAYEALIRMRQMERRIAHLQADIVKQELEISEAHKNTN